MAMAQGAARHITTLLLILTAVAAIGSFSHYTALAEPVLVVVALPLDCRFIATLPRQPEGGPQPQLPPVIPFPRKSSPVGPAGREFDDNWPYS